MNSLTVISFSFYFQGLKKVEGDHHNSIATLEKHLFNAEKKRVEKEAMLRYKYLLIMSKLYTYKQQCVTLWKHATFILFMWKIKNYHILYHIIKTHPVCRVDLYTDNRQTRGTRQKENVKKGKSYQYI
jgi:hypothetical protein